MRRIIYHYPGTLDQILTDGDDRARSAHHSNEEAAQSAEEGLPSTWHQTGPQGPQIGTEQPTERTP